MLTSALNLRPTVLLALIRFCWKDTDWATCDLFSPSMLTLARWPMAPLFLQGLFLPATLPMTFNQHTAAKLFPQRLQDSRSVWESNGSRLPENQGYSRESTSGPGAPISSQALTGVRVSCYQTRVKKHQGHQEVHILTTFADPTLIKQDWGLSITTVGRPPPFPHKGNGKSAWNQL